MKRTLFITWFVVIGAVASLAAQKAVTASDAWVKAAPAGEASTLAFAVVENPTMYDIYLVSATTDAAGSVTFQSAAQTPDAKPQARTELTVPAYGALTMKPDGMQMVLTDLKRPLKPGDTVALTLETDNGLALEVAAVVKN